MGEARNRGSSIVSRSYRPTLYVGEGIPARCVTPALGGSPWPRFRPRGVSKGSDYPNARRSQYLFPRAPVPRVKAACLVRCRPGFSPRLCRSINTKLKVHFARQIRKRDTVAQYSVHIYFFGVNTAFYFILELYPGGARVCFSFLRTWFFPGVYTSLYRLSTDIILRLSLDICLWKGNQVL